MSAWAENNKFAGAALFLKKQATEELMHMAKIFDYVNETGNLALVGKIDAPETEFKTLHDLFKKVLDAVETNNKRPIKTWSRRSMVLATVGWLRSTRR